MARSHDNTNPELIQAGQSFGKFYIVEKIGEGGTSLIFKALQQPINRIVALKIPSFSGNATLLTPDEFLSEATLMARLEHPNIIRIYDFGVSEDRAFICMEYVEGINLLELHHSARLLTLSGILAIARQILEALGHSHSHGVLHLDLSPANVLITKTGQIKLLDFGMAGKKPPTEPGKVIGTPAFLSPEHVQGKTCTTNSDIFSFGSLLYFAATGEQLFDPGADNVNLAEMLREIANARMHPPLDKIGRLPKVLGTLVHDALTGSERDKIAVELKKAWLELERDAAPESVLQRVMRSKEVTHERAESSPATGQNISERYFSLRESGHHREAVALLEEALRQEPNNPLLQQLLTTPPAKPKATPATVVSPTPPGGLVKTPKVAIKPFPLLVGTLVMALGFMILDRYRSSQENKKPSALVANATATPAEPTPLPPEPVPAARDTISPKMKVIKPDRRQGVPLEHKPPALKLSGPNGTRISIDDSAEWVAPSPPGGWILKPGLLNVSLTLPNSSRPINSSLFFSEDTLYILLVDEDGGFSIKREHR